jgi:exodeoxyribonuclease I
MQSAFQAVPSPDVLPDPESCLLTGITPQQAHERGVAEHRFAQIVHAALAAPGTIGVGYNSIRFDDEFTRFLFWRNLIDPYAREWQHECGRWDLLDVVRMAYALRPGGMVWPKHDDGRPSFKLEHLSAANGIAHTDAHDALSDVRATVGLARRLKSAQPRLWDFALRLRRKHAVIDEIEGAQRRGEPFIHVSGRYASERGCMALVWPLSPHPNNRNELIVWDLAQDPSELFTLGAVQIRERLFAKPDALPEGVTRLPIKTIRLNRSPMVVGNVKTLRDEGAARWGIDLDAVRRHAHIAAAHVPTMAGIWPEVYAPRETQKRDVDEDLYGGFLNDHDRRRLEHLRGLEPHDLAARHPLFDDERLAELVFRYRARNFPDTLDDRDRARWQTHCAARLVDGEHGARTLPEFDAALGALAQLHTGERERTILAALRAHARDLEARLGEAAVAASAS